MKKIIAIVLAFVTFCMIIPSYAATFTDIDAKHWAYPAISELVDKGTIGGYTDGSFKPDNTVTRAEFVKMVGEGTEKRVADYSDVPQGHWAYKYVITSGFASDSQNNFNPDKPITRAQTVELLHSRFGKTGVEAPPFIKKEAEKYAIDEDALSWIYTYGILVGDDGLNLRLGDTEGVDTVDQFDLAMNNKCVDSLGNHICEVYKISVKNQSATNTLQVQGKMNLTSNATNMHWMVISATSAETSGTIGDGEGAETVTYEQITTAKRISAEDDVNINSKGVDAPITIDVATGAEGALSTTNTGTNVRLAGGATETFYVVVWLEEMGTKQEDQDATGNYGTADDEGNKAYVERTYSGLVTFDAVDEDGNPSGVTATFIS